MSFSSSSSSPLGLVYIGALRAGVRPSVRTSVRAPGPVGVGGGGKVRSGTRLADVAAGTDCLKVFQYLFRNPIL